MIMSNAAEIGTSKQGIRALTPFAGQLEAIMEAGKKYLVNPVHVSLPVNLLDPGNPSFRIIKDNILVAVVGVDHRSEDDSIVVMRVKVIKGSNKIKTVPVPSKGNSDSSVKVLCDGDDLTMVVDAVYGDAVILKITDTIGRAVTLNNLTDILPRLQLSAGFPESSGEPVTWEEFVANFDEYDGFQENEDDADGGAGGDGAGGDDGENGDGDGDGENT